MVIEFHLVSHWRCPQENRHFINRGKEIVVCGLSEGELDALTKTTKLVINTVGPYVKYGTPVVEACVNNRTHYVDW